MNVDDYKPVLDFVENTEKLIASQGYSYNEAGISYNEIGVQYGGLYGNESKGPKTMTINDYKPDLEEIYDCKN
jgi:hypothetical protein